MGDIKPIGSERLEGMDKLRRIMEIAKYKEVPRQEINDLSTTNYTIRLADGNLYGIVKEKSGYIIKKGLNESNLDYSEPMRSRKHYRSYADAMKKLNLVVSEVNRNEGNVFEVPLIGEQSKKKFILKTPKAPAAPVPGDDLPPPAMETPPAAPVGGDMGMPPAPDMGMPPAPDMGMPPAPGGEGMPPAPGGEGMPPAPEGEGMPPAPEGEGMPPMGDEEGMGMPPAPEGEGMPPMGDEEDIDSDEEVGPMSLKMIQKLTGKLSQKIRSLDKDKGMDSQDIKYVINSIISAIDMKNLDDDDREEIVDKIEGFDDEYGTEGEGELDLSGEDMGDMGDMGSEIEPEIEPEMGAEIEEPKEGYQNVMDSIFSESKIDRLLSKYFNITTEEKPIIERKTKMDYLGKKIQKIEQKKDLVNFSVTTAQEQKALSLFEGYANTRFIGKTNKQNLVLIVNGKEVKVTPNGRTI
jgi:hypothetical protein